MGGNGIDRALFVPEAAFHDYRNDPDCNWSSEWPKSLLVRQALAERCFGRLASSQRMVVDVLEHVPVVLGAEAGRFRGRKRSTSCRRVNPLIDVMKESIRRVDSVSLASQAA